MACHQGCARAQLPGAAAGSATAAAGICGDDRKRLRPHREHGREVGCGGEDARQRFDVLSGIGNVDASIR
jgi:hypothetical protein